MSESQAFKKYYLKSLIIITILFNACGLLFPILRNDDPMLYATIAKHIILTGDWVDLTHPIYVDWLDKPHLPFWITALSFKIFGITSFADALPGFLFNLLGACYTYRLGKYLFNKRIGLLSALIYLSSFHLMLSATTDIRAEVYLMGMITPACYYWLIYFKNASLNIRPLLLGSIFTACAMMTKGIFVLITIGSGVLAILIYLFVFKHKKISNSQSNIYSNQNNFQQEAEASGTHACEAWQQICGLHMKDYSKSRLFIKILLAIILSFILIAPEIICLYLQFDAHPEKVIYGSTHVSGIKWFFWDSQIGRFFNHGAIVRTDVSSIGHYFFFIHTFLWAFLPWPIVFIMAVWYCVKDRSSIYSNIFLLASFFITFIMFSLTEFQLDYYTNIIMPFAAIMCANWFYSMQVNGSINHPVFYFQMYFSIILCLVAIGCSFFIFSGGLLILTVVLGIGILLLFILFSHHDVLTKAVFYPVMAINFVFFFIMLVYGVVYVHFDAGYQIAKYLNKYQPEVVVDFRINSLTLEFYTKDTYMIINDFDKLKNIKKPFYIVAKLAEANDLQHYMNNIVVVKYFSGTTIDKVIHYALDKKELNNNLDKYVVFNVR